MPPAARSSSASSSSARTARARPSPAPRRGGRRRSSRRSCRSRRSSPPRSRGRARLAVDDRRPTRRRSSRSAPSRARSGRARDARRSTRRVIAAQRVPPSAWRTSQSSQSVRSPSASKSQTARSARPMSRWISTVRPSGRPRETAALRPLAGRGGQQRVLGRHPAAARLVEPARHALLDRRRAEHDRLPLRVEDASRAAARGSPASMSSARSSSGRRPSCLMRRCLERRDLDVLDAPRSGAAGSALPISRNSVRVAGRQEAVRALAVRRRSRSLPRERLGHLARRLLGGEDERHAAAEDALEDRPDQRVVRAAEDDRVDVRRLRAARRTRGRRRSVSSPNGSSPSISGTSRGHATGTTSTPASSARTSSRSGRSRPSPRSRAGRCGGCASRARPRAPRARARRRRARESCRWRSGSAAAVAELQATTTSFTPCSSR